MSSFNQLTLGIIFFLIPLVFFSRFRKLFNFISFLFILGSIFSLDIYSYTSDLIRYSDPSVIDYHITTLSIQDFLFFRISSFIYHFFDNRKIVIVFWQLLILFNLIYAERLINNFSKKLKFDYLPGIFIYIVFITIGVQTIFNQIRYGIGFSFLIISIIYALKFIYLKSSRDSYYSIFFIFLSAGMHTNATSIFLLIPFGTLFLSKLRNFSKLQFYQKRIFNIPISMLIALIALALLLTYFSRYLQTTIPYLPFLQNIWSISATQYVELPTLNSLLLSSFYSIFNLLIAYRAIVNTNFVNSIPIFKLINLLGMFSIISLIFPLISRIASLCVFLPLPFFIAYNKSSGTYFFRLYYVLMAMVTIFRFESLFPS